MRPAKKAAIVFLAVLLTLFFAIHTAEAQGGAAEAKGESVLNCTLHPFSCAVYGITWVINAILAALIALAVWLIQVAMQFNQNITNNPTFQIGFGVALSVANLGFVLAIIIIAIATILRRETYGIKQTLWKLVVAAIIVNFSFVISGVIVNFANQLTMYFVNQSSPAGDITGFTTTLTEAFQPSSLFKPPQGAQGGQETPCTAGETWCGLRNVVDRYLGGLRSDWDVTVFLQTLLSMVFTILLQAVIFMTFIALAVLLLIRYLYIGILLILAPLAWLLWIFPAYSGHFKNWWNAFLRWSFFPVITMFFIFLTLATVANRRDYLSKYSAPPKEAKLEETAAAGAAAAIANSELLQTISEEVVVLGLALGGLFAANKLSIKGANVAMGAIGSVGKAVGGYMYRRGKQVTTAPLRTKAGQAVIGGISKIPLVGPYAARGIQRVSVAGGAGLVAEERPRVDKILANLTPEQIARVIPSLTAPQQFTALEKLKNSGDLNLTDMKKYFGPDEEAKFERFGQTKLYKDSKKNTIGAPKAQDDAESAAAARKGGDIARLAASAEKLNTAAEEMVESMNRSDISKSEIDNVFDRGKGFGMSGEGKSEFARSVAHAFANKAPEYVSSVMPKLKSASQKNFAKLYGEELNSLGLKEEEVTHRMKMMTDSMTGLALGIAEATPAGGAQPTAPIPTPPAAGKT